jgi:iron complex outermembrane recepter protein
MKLNVLAAASLLAIAAGPVYAQTAPAEPGVQPGAAPASAPASAPAAEPSKDGLALETVTISAQRIQESAQKAPIAITVIKPEELIRQNITRAEDLSRVAPALVATASGGPNTTFFMRGVGNTTLNSYSDPAISFNYDGIYIGRPNSTQGFFYDLERVEVLKGPQGTLYGRNATGGAINVLPMRPQLKVESAEVQATVGNYASKELQGAINRPVGEDAALRLSATFNKRNGYLSDGTGDQDQRAFRAQFLKQINPDLTTRFGADYSHQGGAGTGSYVYGTYRLVSPAAGYAFTPTPDLGPEVGMHDPRTEAFVQTRFITQAGRLSEATNSYPFQDNANWGLTNETNWTTGAGTLTVQAAYRKADIDSLATTSNFRGYFIKEDSDQLTLEARFAGKLTEKLDYIVGGFFFDEDIENVSAINQLTTLPIQTYETGTRSKAVFGRLTFRATDQLKLTTGLRYTDDIKKMKGQSDIYSLFCGSPAPPQDNCPTAPLMPLVRSAADVRAFYAARGIAFGGPGSGGPNTATIFNTQIPIDSSLSTKKVTYRLAADFEVTPANLLYASYETGFHSGGFNFGRGLETYEPETIGAFTLGSKNRFFDNRLQLNVEAFYWKYKDQQISQFGTDFSTPPAPVFYTSNIGRSTIKGIDVDFELRATSSTRINGGVQFLSTSYDQYTVNQATTTIPNFACPYSLSTFRGAPSYAIDCSGQPALFSPKWTLNLGVEQGFEFNEFNLIARAGTRYRSDFYAATTYQPWLISEAAFQSDASLTLEPYSDRWFVTAFVNNIEDKRRLTQSNLNASLSTQSGLATAPRTFGLRVGARF